MESGNLNFEERFVAFIDILGFKRIIEAIETNPSQSSEQVQILTSVLKLIKSQETDGSYFSNFTYTASQDEMKREAAGGIRATAVSDCIIISSDGDFEGFKELLLRVGSLATDLAIDGLFMRGAITRGNLIHSDGMLLGSAYQKAVELETTARNPCIIFDKSASTYLDQRYPNTFPYSFPTIRKRDDGYQYLSYFPYKAFPPYVKDWSSYLRAVRRHIQKNIALNDSQTIDKYLWLKEEFNFVVSLYRDSVNKNTGEQILDNDVLPV